MCTNKINVYLLKYRKINYCVFQTQLIPFEKYRETICSNIEKNIVFTKCITIKKDAIMNLMTAGTLCVKYKGNNNL